jgi:hypothetical protein
MPELGQFVLYTHRLQDAERAVVNRALDHFREAQNLIQVALHGERDLPGTRRHDVDCAVLAQATPPTAPEIVVTGLKLSDNWFSHTWGLRSSRPIFRVRRKEKNLHCFPKRGLRPFAHGSPTSM